MKRVFLPYLLVCIMTLNAGCGSHSATITPELAAETGNVSVLDEYIAKDPGLLSWTDGVGDTLLDVAITWDEPAVVDLLLARGANVNCRRLKDQRTPLHFAASLGRVSIIPKLLVAGALLEAKTESGMTPLLLACEVRTEAAQLLLARGADVNAVVETGRNGLWFSVRGKNSAVAAALIHAGIRIDHVDRIGRSALDMAVEEGANGIAVLIQNAKRGATMRISG